MIDTLRILTEADLRSLAAALRGRRLVPPFSGTALLRYCLPTHAEAVAASFGRLAEEGMGPDHLALLLESVAVLRAERARSEDIVELVWTGPELPGTANRDTAVVLRDLFAGARDHVLIAGYAVYQGREVFRSLADRMDQRPALRVRMFLDVRRPHGDTSAESEIGQRFAHRFRTQEWPGTRLPAVYYDPRSLAAEPDKRSSLHAKCVVIDRQTAFVSSANFTEAAQVRNIEVGALVHSEHFACQLVEHFEGLAAAKMLLPVPGLGEPL
jgi:phosphatidylserine/phosphatidylglycerophosphate/cardiolipin synthase-like enzyme